MQAILIAISVLIIVGVALLIWTLATDDDRNNIEVSLFDEETETIKFESLCLLPGDSCEYTVRLKSDNTKKYELKLDFTETEERTLKNYARVRIIAHDEIVYDELLKEAFEDEGIILHVNFKENKNTELKFIYYLPTHVGNEAKNAEAIFELQLTATTKEVNYAEG